MSKNVFHLKDYKVVDGKLMVCDAKTSCGEKLGKGDKKGIVQQFVNCDSEKYEQCDLCKIRFNAVKMDLEAGRL